MALAANALIQVTPGLMIWTIVAFGITLFVLQSLALIPVVLFASVFYVFEVTIVVSIQAFIFALLSAIYIGSAIEPEH